MPFMYNTYYLPEPLKLFTFRLILAVLCASSIQGIMYIASFYHILCTITLVLLRLFSKSQALRRWRFLHILVQN
jgi:hypothetical protein